MKKTIFIFCALLVPLYLASVANAEVLTSISGRVIAEDTGEGVGDVFVTAVGQSGEYYKSKTNVNGTYILENIKSGKYFLAFAKEDTAYIQEGFKTEVVVKRGKHAVNVNYVLKVGSSVSGTVYDKDGITPLKGIGVTAKLMSDEDEKGIEVVVVGVTDSDGRYLLQGLPTAEKYLITVEIPGYRNLTKAIFIQPGEIAEGIDFKLEGLDITGISGYVRSSIDNSPVPGSMIILWDSKGKEIAHAYSDEMGQYAIVGIEPGKYKATAFWPNGGGWIDKSNIIVESGALTEVNFEFNKSLSSSNVIGSMWS